jgi:hypothetical protein
LTFLRLFSSLSTLKHINENGGKCPEELQQRRWIAEGGLQGQTETV